ncbi:MAG: Glutamate-pyruvate aminotransferase AlaA [Candidatus Heimdallarchaeota archaeon LC_2]|nr:MAG: Glutamate-pyruvate aminotransferase AlaA [Candidatus Heimdallarchaeota archaeon LC_2]
MEISNRIDSMTYAIRDVQQAANKLKSQGHDILYFNIGDPNKFDFDVPETMQQNLKKYVNSGHYSDSVGEIRVRQNIANYENSKYNISVSPEDVIFTQGVSEGILYLFLSYCNPGDRVLVPGPTYPAYESAGAITQVETVAYRCIEEEGWIPDLDDIRNKITDKTKLIILINPNNPTGAVYSEKTLKGLIDVIGEHDLTLVSDEIYDKQILDDNVSFHSVSNLTKDVPSIILNGFSKNYLAPGWRAAYMYSIDTENKMSDPYEGIRKLCRVRLSPNTAISLAATEALELNPPHLKPMLKKIKDRRDLVLKRFDEMSAISVIPPKAAFYIFPKIHLDQTKFQTDKEFVLKLLESKKILFVHGSGFGEEYGNSHFRMVYLPQPDILEDGLSRLADFLKENK